MREPGQFAVGQQGLGRRAGEHLFRRRSRSFNNGGDAGAACPCECCIAQGRPCRKGRSPSTDGDAPCGDIAACCGATPRRLECCLCRARGGAAYGSPPGEPACPDSGEGEAAKQSSRHAKWPAARSLWRAARCTRWAGTIAPLPERPHIRSAYECIPPHTRHVDRCHWPRARRRHTTRGARRIAAPTWQ